MLYSIAQSCMNNAKMPISQHLKELKARILICFVVFLCAFGLVYLYADAIYGFIARPLFAISNNKVHFVSLHATDIFFLHLRISSWFAFMSLFPFFEWHLYRFIAPGLLKEERTFSRILLISIVILFFAGATVAYVFVIPKSLEYFISFTNESTISGLMLNQSIVSYLDFIQDIIFGFGLTFQMPILLILLVKFDILTCTSLKRFRRIAIVLIFIFSAIITPPDVLSQILLAIPMMGMYEISILLSQRL